MHNKKIDYKTLAKTKALDSFRTKLKLYLFGKALKGTLSTDKIAPEDFAKPEEENTIRELYTSQYHQYLDSEKIGDSGLTRNQIYNSIQAWEKANQEQIEVLREEYTKGKIYEDLLVHLEKLDPENASCCYCGITVEKINQLIDRGLIHKKANRGFKLEVERFDSNKEYTTDNVDLACYWCNNAKTDEFTAKEFKENIAPGITKVWNKRLNFAGLPQLPTKK